MKDDIKIQIKENIQTLIDAGDIEASKKLIEEYKKVVQDDVEIYSMRAVVAIMEEQLDEAEKIIKSGLQIDNNNFDLLFNLAYIYENLCRSVEAKAAYIIANKVCNDDSFKKQIQEKIISFNKKNYTFKVILCGDAKLCEKFHIQMKEWNIIGYIDEKNKNEDVMYPIISMERISDYNYDFIMILNEDDERTIREKLMENHAKNVYLYSVFRTSVIEGFDYKIRKLLSEKNIELVITGLSYAEVGIRSELLNKKSINFALSAQDLFYDYKIAKYLLNYSEIKNSVKYLIMGLAYYSFDYDITKSIAKYRIHRYLDYIEDTHNNNDKIGIYITKCFYEKRLSMEYYEEMSNIKDNTILEDDNPEQEYISQKNSSMNYKLSRKENTVIFEKYLKILKYYNIKPIIVISPTSKYYYKYFKNGYQKNKFYKIIEKFKKAYDFQVIDYFNSDLFEDNDFWDHGHLNRKGAEKFTQILNNEIQW